MVSSATLVDRLAGQSHRTAIRVAAMLFVTALTAGGGADQRAGAVYRRALHLPANRRAARWPRARLAARHGKPGPLSPRGNRRFARVRGVRHAAARRAAPARTNGWVSGVVSVCGIRRGISGRARFDRRYLTSVLAMLAGLVVIYACGTIWLATFVRGIGLRWRPACIPSLLPTS
jgi:hypothetical protein